MPKPIRKVASPIEGADLFIGPITMERDQGVELDVAVDEREARFHFSVGITNNFPLEEYYASNLVLNCNGKNLGGHTLVDLTVSGVGNSRRIDGGVDSIIPLSLGNLGENKDGAKEVRVNGVVKTGHFYVAETHGLSSVDETESEEPGEFQLALAVTGSKTERKAETWPVSPAEAAFLVTVSD